MAEVLRQVIGLLQRPQDERAYRGAAARFAGEVIGVVERGAFVRFGEEGFEGFLPSRRLDGWWTLNELGTALVVEGSGRELRLGDSLEVVVDRVEAPRGRVDLSPAWSYS